MKVSYISVLTVCLFVTLSKGAPKEEQRFEHFELNSKHATYAHWSIQGGKGIVQISFPTISDGMPFPRTPSTQVWLLQADGTASKASSRDDTPIGISNAGGTTPLLGFRFSSEAASSAVAVVVKVGNKFSVHSLTPAKESAEQGGADQPATAREAKPEGDSKTQLESKGFGRSPSK